jgi:hypothetical protein
MFARTGLKVWCVALVVMGVSVAYGQPPFVKNLTGFEQNEIPGGGYIADDEVLFQEPKFSGTTVRYDQSDPDIEPDGIYGFDPPDDVPWSLSHVVDYVHHGTGAQSYEITFNWGNPADTDYNNSLYPNDPDPRDTGTNDIVRCTTSSALNLARPSVSLGTGGKIKFWIAALAYDNDNFVIYQDEIEASILLVAGVRETGTDLPQGTTDTGGGDIEWVYPDGAGADGYIPPNTNGVLPSPTYPGGLRIHTSLDPDALVWTQVVVDLGDPEAIRGFANDGTAPATAGDGLLNAVTWGVGDGVNRGSWENITFTNDPTDTAGKVFYIYVDDVVLESGVADPAQPPTIQGPVYDTDTQVLVNCASATQGGEEAELFVNDISVGTADIVGTQATFSFTLGDLHVNDVLRATQTVYGDTSDLSAPVVVTAEGVYLADDFDLYASHDEMVSGAWTEFGANPLIYRDGEWRGPVLTSGSAASCDNLVVSDYHAGSPNLSGTRLYRQIGPVNGSDAEPLIVTYKFQHRGQEDLYGARGRFELMPGSTAPTLTTRRLGATGFAFHNDDTSNPNNGDNLPPIYQDYYNILLEADDTATYWVNSNGFYTDYFLYEMGLTPIAREPNVWHEMKIEIKTDVINYYIDNVLANPVDTNGVPQWPGGVPRPTPDDYYWVVLGIGYSNNGVAMMYDDVSVTVGTTGLPFGPANQVGSPTVVEPVYPGDPTIDLVDLSTNADFVTVYEDGSTNGTLNGPFPTGAATVTLDTPVGNGVELTVTQTVGGIESCISKRIGVFVPTVTLESPIVPTQPTVEVSNVNTNGATKITVYRGEEFFTEIGSVTSNGVFDTPTVTVPVSVTLANGDVITATQWFDTDESPASDPVTVSVPAPSLPGPLVAGDEIVTVTGIHPLASAITVYVNGSSNGFVNTTGVTEFDVPVSPPLAAGDTVVATQTIGPTEGPDSNSITVPVGYCKVLFSSDLSNSNGLHTLLLIPDDDFADYGYDYGQLMGIPPPPGHSDTIGLKLHVNRYVNDGGEGAATVYTDQTFSGVYQVSFDVWGNYDTVSGGTTTYFGGGIGFSGTVPIQMWYGGGGVGGYLAMVADNSSALDYRMYKNSGLQYPASGQYDVTTNNNTDPAFAPISPSVDISTFDPPQTGQTGTTDVGCPSFNWQHVVITVDETAGTANINIDGLSLGTLNANIGSTFPLTGAAQLFAYDYYASLSGNYQFAVFDNLVVSTQLTPGGPGDWDGDADVDLVDFQAFADCLDGPDTDPDPVTGAVCIDACLQVFDADADDDVDLEDFAAFQTQF